jgi:drug/metabolite transporter (DMT)-like permease
LEPKTLAGFFAMIAFTVAANLMLKLGAGVPEAQRIFGVLGWKSVAGLASFGCGGTVYAFLLRPVPLNIAQVFEAAQFVRVVIAGRQVLGEAISPTRWLGIACNSFGIMLVGLTANVFNRSPYTPARCAANAPLMREIRSTTSLGSRLTSA